MIFYLFWDDEADTVFLRLSDPDAPSVGLRSFSEENLGEEWCPEITDISAKINSIEEYIAVEYGDFVEDIHDYFDWDFISSLHLAYAEEIYLDAISFLKDNIPSTDTIIAEDHPFEGSSVSVEKEKLRAVFREKKMDYQKSIVSFFYTHIDFIKNILSISEYGVDFESFIEILNKNFHTGGTVYIAVAEELKRLIDIHPDDEEQHEELFALIGRLLAAHNRHTKTKYDAIDKRGMSDDEVRALRREYNSL